jgi:hypothetical protein
VRAVAFVLRFGLGVGRPRARRRGRLAAERSTPKALGADGGRQAVRIDRSQHAPARARVRRNLDDSDDLVGA